MFIHTIYSYYGIDIAIYYINLKNKKIYSLILIYNII